MTRLEVGQLAHEFRHGHALVHVHMMHASHLTCTMAGAHTCTCIKLIAHVHAHVDHDVDHECKSKLEIVHA